MQFTSLQHCTNAADHLLKKFYNKPLCPPIDIEYLAKCLGFQVVRIYAVGDECSGIVSPKHKLIGVNGNHHPHRQRFTIAHEVGHILLHHPAEQQCTVREVAAFNREADMFASELLVPSFFLASVACRFHSERTIARLFDVSDNVMLLKIGRIRSNDKLV